MKAQKGKGKKSQQDIDDDLYKQQSEEGKGYEKLQRRMRAYEDKQDELAQHVQIHTDQINLANKKVTTMEKKITAIETKLQRSMRPCNSLKTFIESLQSKTRLVD